MLIPRFSLRWLLFLVTLCAGVSLVLAAAVRREHWGIGAAAALASILVVAGLHVVIFLAAWLATEFEVNVLKRRGRGVSPFASGVALEAALGAPPPAVESPTDSPPAITG